MCVQVFVIALLPLAAIIYMWSINATFPINIIYLIRMSVIYESGVPTDMTDIQNKLISVPFGKKYEQ